MSEAQKENEREGHGEGKGEGQEKTSGSQVYMLITEMLVGPGKRLDFFSFFFSLIFFFFAERHSMWDLSSPD